jgi:hypothetical protein
MSFALSLPRCPKLLLIWTKGHPYWHNFEKYLYEKEHETLIYSYQMEYTRLSEATVKLMPDSNILIEKIHSDDYDLIDAMHKLLQNEGTRNAAAAFDFSIDTFGSQALEQMVRSNKECFWREYLHLTTENACFLVILTKYPLGANPNRVVDSAWTFQSSGSTLSQAEWKYVCASIKEYGLKNGVSIPSVRRVYCENRNQSFYSNCEQMNLHIMHPRLLRFFI